jgi:hypothetical protein
MNKLIFVLLFAGTFAHADADFFFLPRAAVGYNVAQGTYFTVGADVGTYFTENISGGLSAYYAAGEHPGHDREIGGGPFVSYVQPLTSFLMFSAREELDYIDMYIPKKTLTPSGTEWSHQSENGVASSTSVGVHLFLTKHFVISGGYRLMVGLSNSKLGEDRSGTFFGLSFGI